MTDRNRSEVGPLLGEEEMLEILRRETDGVFEIGRELGRGGMATVYVAYDRSLGRKVAIKVMSAEVIQKPNLVQRFEREARIAASLTHPHIIPIHAVGETEHFLYFVMKYVEGRTLHSIINEVGPLPVEMVQAILAQVGDALGYAHRRGVVHRDMKPDNIMIDGEGWAVVTDFGISKSAETSSLTTTGEFIGTPTYMSPEQFGEGEVTGAADQYALGVVTYEMLAGVPPFTNPSLMSLMWAQMHTPPPPLHESRPDCPEKLEEIVMRMLEKAPADRFPGLEDVVTAVGATPLPRDDPMRVRMINLAKANPTAGLFPRSRTPSNPISVATKRTTPRKPRPWAAAWMPSRWLLASVVLVGGGFVAWRVLDNADRVAAPPGVGDAQEVTASAEVTAALTLILDEPSGPIEVGGSVALSARAVSDGGERSDPGEVRWFSSSPALATVSGDGVVTGVAPGPVVITVANATQRAAVTVVVRSSGSIATGVGVPPAGSPGIAELRLDPSMVSVTAGESVTLTAAARNAAGQPVDVPSLTWSSGDALVATVSADGTVMGVREGATVITATAGLMMAAAAATVTRVPVATISVSPPPGPLAPGVRVSLSVVLRDPDSAVLTDRMITWSSSDEDVVSMSSGGVATAGAPGRAVLTATSEAVRGSVNVVVSAPLADVRPAIEALLRDYAAALQARDIDAVKQLYPDLPRDREQRWSDLFTLGELEVSVHDIDGISVDGDRATVQFNQTVDGRRIQRNITRFTAVLSRTVEGWRFVSIR